MFQDQLLLSSSIRALGKWIFDGDPSSLSYDDLKKLGFSALAAGLLPDRLPETLTAAAKKDFLFLQMRDLAQQQTMQQIDETLTKCGIPCCPFKGADLAMRVYPAGAFRPRGDLDVLIPASDRKRALRALRDAGWEQPYRYFNLNHEAEMFRRGICLELHFKLPGFAQNKMSEVWQNIVKTPSGKRHLVLEFDLLMLFQHCAGHAWRHAVTLLTDCAFLLKKEGIPDWEKIHSAAQEMHLLDPALLFRAFDDFFPAETMPPEKFPPEILVKFRRMLLAPAVLPHSTQEKALRETDRFSPSWWQARFNGLRPGVIRCKTGNPRGNHLKLWWDYLVINGGKLFAFLGGLYQIRKGKIPLREPDEKNIRKFLISPKGN